ncbi:pfs domain-containing [Pyrenophora seminiperda CCB06]|uniref:Pfs domain-containing n=1 Tax=Pyrenophora seminiperda CCB06 TaxID=1302712 RepID=A0A3M7M1X1_9PLEO|nr:pfs domain-containing [Pyrenophora seminiperda CCB06]
MAFVCEALAAHHQAGKAIGVTNIFYGTGWRLMLCIRGAHRLGLLISRMSPLYLVWRIIWGVASLVAHRGFNIKDFYDNRPFRNIISRTWINLLCTTGVSGWPLFWYLYFFYAEDQADFLNDYRQAWDIQPGYDREIVLFVDNGERVLVPLSTAATDKEILEQLRIFYDLTRTGGGIFELFGAKSSQRIDIVELQDHAVGDRHVPPLELGLHGPYSRHIHYFRDPSHIEGSAIKTRLVRERVLTVAGQHTCALNIVRSWDPYATSLIVLFPVAVSLGVSITWSVVANVHFGADAQASTQTGFTIGSYVITAGTLLIALVAFLDTKVKDGER